MPCQDCVTYHNRCLCSADCQEAAQQQQSSTLFAYKPVTMCTGTYERLVFSEQQGSDIQLEIACRGVAR